MLYYTVFVLAVTLCCTNAAFTINVYDNAVAGQKDTPDVEDCNYQECDQFCRRLGFPGGACVGDRCECDNFRGSAAAQKDTFDLEDCNYRECDQLCRRLGFPGGACVGDRCKCDNFRESAAVAAQKEILDVEACNYGECGQFCRRLGYPGGVCAGDRCECYNFRGSTESNEVPMLDAHHKVQDVKQDLEQPGQHGETLADKHLGEQEVIQDLEQPDVNMRSVLSRGNCDCVPRNCDMYCFRIHYTGGICVTGQCRCYK